MVSKVGIIDKTAAWKRIMQSELTLRSGVENWTGHANKKSSVSLPLILSSGVPILLTSSRETFSTLK